MLVQQVVPTRKLCVGVCVGGAWVAPLKHTLPIGKGIDILQVKGTHLGLGNFLVAAWGQSDACAIAKI